MSEPIGSIQQVPASKVARLVATRVYGRPAGWGESAVGGGAGGAEKNRLQAGPTDHRLETGATGALPFYTNPASRVEAATAIALGRALDVKG